MKPPHLSSARHLARQSSTVVNGEFAMIKRSTVSKPSTPQSSAEDGEDEGVDDELETVATVVVGELVSQSRL